MTKLRYSMFVVTVLLALALSAMLTVPALADDSAPPPTETPTVETPPIEEVAPVVEAAAPTDVPAAEVTAPPASTDAGLLASLPEGTDLVVLDESGSALPLASTEVANAVEDPDPLWCPTGVAPKPFSMNPACSDDFGSLSALLADNSGSPYANGTIWIQWGPDSGTAAVIDGFAGNWAGSSPFSLTLQGGWEGTYGSSALHLADPYSYFDTSIFIDWAGAVTLNNIVFSGVTSGDALTILTEKNITLNNVDVVDNTGGDGAILDNTFGLGNVAINNSTFNGNSGYGLSVYSNGTITAKNLNANNNSGGGTWLDNSYAATAKAVTLTGSNNFKFNALDGLVVYSNGAITLNNVTAIYNTTGHGVYVDNCFYDYVNQWCTNSFVSAVTAKGTNNFSNNGYDGLRVWSQGAITLYNTTANNNGTDPSRPGASNPSDPNNTGKYDGTGKGVYLYNWAFPAKVIKLIGTNTFNGNAETGLYMRSFGAVTLNNITAINNGQNCNSPAAICDGVHMHGSVGFTLLGHGVFNDNFDEGLEVHSKGAVTLNNLYAENNGYWGVFVDSWGPNSVVNVLGSNTFINNVNSGLYIWSEGAVTLNNITANDNGVDGVYVDNCLYDNTSNPSPLIWDCFVTTPKPVTLKGTNFFNGNVGTGFNVFSTGVITTNNITALFNGAGVNLDNCIYEANILVENCKALAGKAVTMNGVNNINDNSGVGLWISSLGAIKVNKVTANDNGLNGAYLDNQFGTINSALTLLGYGTFTGNGDTNLVVYSHGNIILNNVTANGSTDAGGLSTDGGGAYIDNKSNTTTPVSVTLLGVNSFSGNAGTDGLIVFSDGAITLNNVTANDNNGYGAYLNNTNYQILIPLKVANITLNGTNTFVNNFFDGLYFEATGNVVLTRIIADFNDGFSNSYAGSGVRGVAAGTITLTCGSMTNNEGSGYNLTAGIGKLITLKGVFTYGNGLINVFSSPMVSPRTCPLP